MFPGGPLNSQWSTHCRKNVHYISNQITMLRIRVFHLVNVMEMLTTKQLTLFSCVGAYEVKLFSYAGSILNRNNK
jgi:hypothetical protein